MKNLKILAKMIFTVVIIIITVIFSSNHVYAQKCHGNFGDYVWNDANGDGVQNASESGIQGVKIIAYRNGHYYKNTSTNGAGLYNISYSGSGRYIIEIDQSTAPSGYSATTPISYEVIINSSGNYYGFDFGLSNNCSITKAHGRGYYTSITSVVNNGGSYTIVLKVEHSGCYGPHCHALSHYSVQATPGTYSNVSVNVLSGSMTYSCIDMGPNIGEPFYGFKIENTSGIGDGQPGVFTITYTLQNIQNQYTNAKAGPSNMVHFSGGDFMQILNCTNNPPVAVDDSYTTEVNTPVSNNVMTNDSDPDGDNITANTTPVSGPSHGSVILNSDGSFIYTPNTGYTGTDTFVYEICDDGTPSLCDQATVTITIQTSNDSDGDGVPDADDDYPYDPDRAFDNYYPATGYSTLAYEDLWPGKGDYDFNDLVLDFKFQMVTNSSNKVVEIFGTFIIKAFGAGYENGFGFQLANDNVAQSHITVTGYDLQEGYITLNANGTEAGQSKPTIIVYDNTFNIMQHPGQGIGVNTDQSAPYVTPDTLNITMEFTHNTYTLAQIDIPNFNPFIIVNQNRGVEVHLPDYEPTDLVDQGYFGTFDDDSDPLTGKYYKTQNNLPWAINIYESFDYPKEKIQIPNAYYHFVEWAESGGTSYPDWYQDNPGYRNESNIYSPPSP